MSDIDPDLLKMHLAGTVSFPPKNQGYGTVTVFDKGKRSKSVTLVKIEQGVEHENCIARTVFRDDVKAVFEPKTSSSCELSAGTWHAGAAQVKAFIDKKQDADSSFEAIVFVSEDAQSLLETKVGMTAAECAEFYPPTPRKTTAGGHYAMTRTGCTQTACNDYPPPPIPGPGGP